MSDQQRQLILAAYRPGGQDDSDPAMQVALEALEQDPELKHQFEQDLAFDRMFASSLANIPVPSGLRDSIVAGADLATTSRPTTLSKFLKVALPLAALITVLAVVTKFVLPTPQTNLWQQQSIAALGTYLAPEGDSTLLGADAFQTAAWIESNINAPVTLPTLLDGRPSRMCRLIERADGSVAVICFDAGEGTTLHLTIHKNGDETAPELPTSPDGSPITTSGNWEYIAWRDENFRYLLAASTSSAPCCDKLRQIAQASF